MRPEFINVGRVSRLMLFKVMQLDKITKEMNTDEGEMESEMMFHCVTMFRK